jgi:hypothetical protein
VKWKVALLLLAAVCSSVLVVSAQTQPGQHPAVELTPVINVDPSIQPPQGGYAVSPWYGLAGGQSQEEGNLANQANRVAHELGSAQSDTDREKLKTRLSTILEKQFELRQERHMKEIKSLEAQVKKLRDLVDKRQENRREIVAKRLDQILQEAQGLGW